ncbi:AtpZ/AtpI family protein [Thioclava litoralis]|uniref:ATP synthase protein I n=1 Tax=Thioclava litoralis TaxID=3076557 RepID=A0ABZ1DZ69_9RHOB|nr:AtpZ/AtpI family protein [Thioclava sp. FTW29]
MSNEPDPERLKALEDRLAKVSKQASGQAEDAPRGGVAQSELAWRMVIELVSGLGIGFGIGYGLDVLLGTLPIFMIIFVLLGLIAGVRVMMRTAAEINAKPEAGSTADEEGK